MLLSAQSAIRETFAHVPRHNVNAVAWRNAIRPSRAIGVLAAELALATVSYAAAAFSVGHQFEPLSLLRGTVVITLALHLVALLWTRLYRRSLRYASSSDLVCVAKAVLASSVPLAAFLFWRFGTSAMSLAIVDASFLLILWCALHFSIRAIRAQRSTVLGRRERRVLIIGAGDAGISLLSEIANDPSSPFQPVAILDDDVSKWGRTICGLPVLGGTDALSAIAAGVKAEEVLVCIPSATQKQMRAIVESCRHTELPVRTLPPLAEILRHGAAADKSSATVSRRDLRPPRIEDLLDRDVIRIDENETRALIEGQVVLITGAGGSIGSELTRQVASARPSKLILLDKSENGLFHSNREAVEKLGASAVQPVLGDLLDRERVRRLFRAERPSLVFHAAAYKHVAMMDLYPREAIRNNVMGTRNVAEAALQFGAGRFVNISTDKAVNPRNWMGLSKKLTELCIEELSTLGTTRFSNVRFGNVAGSSGSVLPLFWERIERQQPIRVSDPRATRFFMSIPEAVHLILRAAALGSGGETFVFEMGKPVNIYELAKTMMLCSGLRPGRDLQIEFTGLQPGEKVDEELWESRENPIQSGSDHILVIREKHPLSLGIGKKIGRMEDLLLRGTETDALDYVCTLFPEFRWNRANLQKHDAPFVEHVMARSAGAA
ncbi:MAG TPA: nucleoside-diphosphate sugar epimerase/dehydratase [Candidatus Acidoferrales bacterium]